MKDSICREASLLTGRVMESYISGDPVKIESMIPYFSPDIIVIGTGKHEFYHNLESLLQWLEKDQEEASGIEFMIKRQWFEAKQITEDACVVYGEFEACETNTEGKQVIINMDTRITASVHREADGKLMIDSIHQSVPYIYQQEGEYYPKTFANLAEKALKRSAVLEKSIQLDSMTGLYNRQYTELHINRLLTEDKAGGLMFVIDLDDFKHVNDCFGHLAGDELLKKASRILADNVKSPEIAGRVGGDEFMIFLPGERTKEEGEKFAERLISQISEVLGEVQFEQSCSIGIACAKARQADFEDLYYKADRALYMAKASGKAKYCWYHD